MEIKIFQPLFLNEKGKRDNNEDSIFPFPQQASDEDKLFIVCDGVGGVDKGEVASHLACTEFSNYFVQNKIIESSEQTIFDAFAYVQQKFDDYIAEEPSAKGFGTTLVLLHFHKNGITVAHCGDSRLYQIRENKIIFTTTDHTPVNELVRNGILTPEEAAQKPKSSRISRAIQGNSVMRTKPDTEIINNLKENDYLFLCSDGIHGSVSDNELVDIFSANISETEKSNTIKTLCEANSNDNYSIYILKIKEVQND